MSARRRCVVSAAAAVVALSGCGVPLEKSAHPVADELPTIARAGSSTTVRTPVRTEPVRVYWIRRDRIVPATEHAPSPVSLAEALRLLQAGPAAGGSRSGVRSALEGAALVRSATVTRSTASVDLDPSFSDIPTADQILALAQVVLTATARPGIDRVRLVVDGERAQIPRADGSLTTGAVTAADYGTLLAR